MKTEDPKPLAVKMLLVVVCILLPATSLLNAQTDGYLLMVQSSPVDSGTITPQTGIYRTSLNDTVTLTAIAKTGYRFVCWLGEVGEPTANSTTILVDAPKIVIAIFEREEYETMSEEGILVPGRGTTGLRRNPNRVRAGASISPGGGGIYDPPDWSWPDYDDDDVDVDEIDDFPVPDTGDDFPVPDVPEPATLLILGSGAFGLFFLRKSSPR